MTNFNNLNKIQEKKQKPFGIDEFFSQEAPVANKQNFADQIYNLSPYDRDKIELFFEQMKNGVKLHISVMSNLDLKKNIAYYHVSVRSENGSRGYKLPDIEGISKLIEIYIDGKHKIELKLEDVYNASII